MDTLELLTTRRSTKSLTTPAPDELQLETMLQAASQVPDHGNLTPWRFIVIHSEAGKTRLHQALLKAVDELNLGEDTRAKTHKVINLAPMIIAVIASPKSGKPEWEQQMSAACSAYALQLAAQAQGFDSIWITGLWVGTEQVRAAFNCGEKEKILGFIMVGTAENACHHGAKNTDSTAFTEIW